MGGYPEDPDESNAPPPEPPPQRPRPSRPPPPRPRPTRPPPPPKRPPPKPRLFKFRYFYKDTSFSPRPFQKSSRPQIPPEAPEIVNENPWTSARSDWQKKSEIEPRSLNSEEEEDI